MKLIWKLLIIISTILSIIAIGLSCKSTINMQTEANWIAIFCGIIALFVGLLVYFNLQQVVETSKKTAKKEAENRVNEIIESQTKVNPNLNEIIMFIFKQGTQIPSNDRMKFNNIDDIVKYIKK